MKRTSRSHKVIENGWSSNAVVLALTAVTVSVWSELHHFIVDEFSQLPDGQDRSVMGSSLSQTDNTNQRYQ